MSNLSNSLKQVLTCIDINLTTLEQNVTLKNNIHSIKRCVHALVQQIEIMCANCFTIFKQPYLQITMSNQVSMVFTSKLNTMDILSKGLFSLVGLVLKTT